MRVLVTGGAGFIGTNFIKYMLAKQKNWEFINIDKLTYAGNLENLPGLKEYHNYLFLRGDIADYCFMEALFQKGIDIVINFAAESHVDRSIQDSDPFIKTNIVGTHVLLKLAKRYKIRKFIQVSTDEVYGSLGPMGEFSEESSLCPNSPYSASKASADLLCRSFFKTYDLPVLITRCSNNFGPYQFPEKFIPLIITNAFENKYIPVYGNGLNVRDWIYVEDHCRALETIIFRGRAGEVYNIGAGNELSNFDLVQKVLKILNKPTTLVKFIKDRPGHDQRYAVDNSKIKTQLGWQPVYSFEKSIIRTISWYLEHPEWWKRIKSGEYLEYYRKWYDQV